VLAFGILGLLTAIIFLPIGLAAWILGARDLRGMKDGGVDPSGRSLTQVGWVSGIAGTILAFAHLLVLSIAVFAYTRSNQKVEQSPAPAERMSAPAVETK
jgi:hypothetical protein